LKILFIGDIFGRPGRAIVKERLPELRKQHAVDLVIANCENAAAGFGITPQLAEELFDLGIDVMTTGNHVWDKREIIEYFQMADGNRHSPARRLLRPANLAQGLPGWGVYEGQKNGVTYAVMNLQGRVFMGSSDDPFRYVDRLLERGRIDLLQQETNYRARHLTSRGDSARCRLGRRCPRSRTPPTP